MELEREGKKLCDIKIPKDTNRELLSSFPGPSFLISRHSRHQGRQPLQQAPTAPFWDKPGVTPGKERPHLLP